MTYGMAVWGQKQLKAMAVGVWGLLAHISLGQEAREINVDFLLFSLY